MTCHFGLFFRFGFAEYATAELRAADCAAFRLRDEALINGFQLEMNYAQKRHDPVDENE